MRDALLPSVAALLLALPGCNCGSSTNVAQGELVFTADIQFGILGVGEVVTRPAWLENVGNGAAQVSSITATQPGFTACIVQPDASCAGLAALEAGDKAEVRVSYAPTEPSEGPDDYDVAYIVAKSDSPLTPEVKIHVVGHAVPARLAVEPPSLDFGELYLDETKELSVTLTNRGAAPIVLSDPSLSSTAFQTDLDKLGATLVRDAFVTATVTYAPKVARDDLAILQVTTDVSNQATVQIPLKGRGLLEKVSLCYHLSGEPEQCLPTPAGVLAGVVDFGAMATGESRSATVVLKNEGNVQVSLVGMTGHGQVSDETRDCPPPHDAAPSDFTFVPSDFGAKLPDDPTAQVPDPPNEKSLSVTYQPSYHCPDDVTDSAVISLKAGTSPTSRTFRLDLRGSATVGLAQPKSVFWDLKQPTPKDYTIANTGPGPLHVTSVEFVEADGRECAMGCADRVSCAGSSRPECGQFTWLTGPDLITVQPAVGGAPTEGVIGQLLYTPGIFCPIYDAGSPPDGGACYTTNTLRLCVRIGTDDPFTPQVCGELEGKVF